MQTKISEVQAFTSICIMQTIKEQTMGKKEQRFQIQSLLSGPDNGRNRKQRLDANFGRHFAHYLAIPHLAPSWDTDRYQTGREYKPIALIVSSSAA